MTVVVRLLQGALVLWGAFTVSFVVLYLLPGDAVSILLAGGAGGELGQASEAEIAALRAEYHLDRPLVVQYLLALWGALRLDFGRSIQTGQPVIDALIESLPHTLQLTALALALSVIIGVTLAVAATYARSPRWATVIASLPALGVAIPTFWIGLILLQVFSFRLGLLPAVGNTGFASLILPALTLAVPNSAVIAQVLLRSLEDIWQQSFITALRGKGLSRLALVLRHGVRNAVIPALSLAGVIAGNFLAGSVVVETVFTRDGFGRLTQMAVQTQDIPVVQGVVLFAAAVFVLTSLIVDLLYPVLDPRMRSGRSSRAAGRRSLIESPVSEAAR